MAELQEDDHDHEEKADVPGTGCQCQVLLPAGFLGGRQPLLKEQEWEMCVRGLARAAGTQLCEHLPHLTQRQGSLGDLLQQSQAHQQALSKNQILLNSLISMSFKFIERESQESMIHNPQPQVSRDPVHICGSLMERDRSSYN